MSSVEQVDGGVEGAGSSEVREDIPAAVNVIQLNEDRWSLEALHEWLREADADVEIRPTNEGCELWCLNSLEFHRDENGKPVPAHRTATFYGDHAHIQAARFAAAGDLFLVTANEELHKLDPTNVWPQLTVFQMLLVTKRSVLMKKFPFMAKDGEPIPGEPND